MANIPFTSISATQLAEQLRGEKAPQLLDCREPQEWEYCHLAGARHIPIGQIPWRCSELDATRPIVVYCHHGMRSQAVCEFLIQRGFSDVANLTGGIDAWSCSVDPRVPRY
ncbi:MAG: rhodanese-like domain-containing protein [Pirellulaceae bacterium]